MRTVALIAHDQKKQALADWAAKHRKELRRCKVICTANTGKVILKQCPNLRIRRVKSGPLGGDLQIGSMIADGKIDALIFFADPLTAMPHDVDIKALFRIALVYDVVCAFNASTANRIFAGGWLSAK
jgi:methylglyoxal synthase